jgi:hypothetical protein
MLWKLSFRACPVARRLADRHYSRRRVGAADFVPPGRCLVLLTHDHDALWVSSWQKPEFCRHAWAGAWVCSLFRNESTTLSSLLIRDAVAATLAAWGTPPALGFITFVDSSKTRRKRDPGRCYRKAGWRPAQCPVHQERSEGCAACRHETLRGLFVLQQLGDEMPEPKLPVGWQMRLFD